TKDQKKIDKVSSEYLLNEAAQASAEANLFIDLPLIFHILLSGHVTFVLTFSEFSSLRLSRGHTEKRSNGLLSMKS
ncbi:hypothetical protein HAX54_032043, partial [Datura stramonium]|nr:hypothetical protein [Datura stramonium]